VAQNLEDESGFFSAMDGASKFDHGDAIVSRFVGDDTALIVSTVTSPGIRSFVRV
jgi:flagellar biosynthesis component FlhA